MISVLIGWFELMSVDGRTAPVMTSVRQLVDVFPARCLVRKSINAMTIDDLCRGDGTRSRIVVRGELLKLVRVTGQRLLQCRDERDRDVYLLINQRGLFSAINGHTAANVYTLRSLLAEFRLPIIVRLVFGSLPTRDATAGDLRLVGIQTDRVTFVLPLRHAWTSRSVDRRALIAVPSRHASRLTVAAAAREFYYHWIMSDDGLELQRRCDEIVASWKVSVHVVSSSIAAAAAAAASSAAVPRSYEGDHATWSRGPIGSSLDSGLTSSTSSPCMLQGTGDALYSDHDDSVERLEQEIDDIYAMIRYGGDGVALKGRAKSLDDRLSAGEVFSYKPTLDGSRRPSADVLRASQMPTTITIRSARGKVPAKFVEAVQLSSPHSGMARQSSTTYGVDNVKLVAISFRPEDEMDTVDDDLNVLSADHDDHDSQEVATSAEHLPEPDTVVSAQPQCPLTEANDVNCVEMASTTPNPVDPQRPRSKSLPEVTVATPEPRQRKRNKSLIDTFTRSIANVFRRMRPHKASHTFTVDTGHTTVASERYRRKTYDYTDTNLDIACN